MGNFFSGVPIWAWLFVVACAAIPIISLGGALPAALGAGGAFGCLQTARDTTRSTGVRLAICAAITVVCWVLFIALAAGLAMVMG